MKNRAGCLSFIFLLLLLLCCGCSADAEKAEEEKNVVVIPVMLRADPQTGELSNMELVNAFNEAYAGRYRVEVEWLVETETGYRTKLKQLNATDKLPAVITDVGFDDKFLQLLIENRRLVNLAPYMEKSEEWRLAMQSGIGEEIREADGAVYVSPLGNLMYSSAGIVYNKALLEQAGYEEFPDTWQDFMECLQKLKEAGITPLALHGSGNYWVPMLFSTAYCSTEADGMTFLKEKFPDSYCNDAMRRMMEFMKTLYAYTYEDALEIEYADAERRFFNGEAAIIANGPWMFMELADEEKVKYGFIDFPGGTLVGSWEMTAWAAVSTYPEEVQEGAAAFLQFRTLKDRQDVEADIRGIEGQEDGIMRMYQEKAWNSQELVPNYQINWEQEIINDYLITYLPQYIENRIGLEEFLKKMDAQAEQIRQNQ